MTMFDFELKQALMIASPAPLAPLDLRCLGGYDDLDANRNEPAAAEPAAAEPAAAELAATKRAFAAGWPPASSAVNAAELTAKPSVKPVSEPATRPPPSPPSPVFVPCDYDSSSPNFDSTCVVEPPFDPSKFFQGLDLYELARVPEEGLRVDSITCRFGRLASSNAAIAFELGAHSYEIYATSQYVDGALQSRVNGMMTLGDGTKIMRQDNRINIALGRVLVDVRVQFNELAGRLRVNVRVYSPIRDVLDPELTGLCARNVSGPGVTVGVNEVPMLAANETVFDTNATRYTDLIAECGLDEPSPLLCDNPGTEGCCPALPTLDDAEMLCSFALCDGEAYPRCLYDCCLSDQAVVDEGRLLTGISFVLEVPLAFCAGSRPLTVLATHVPLRVRASIAVPNAAHESAPDLAVKLSTFISTHPLAFDDLLGAKVQAAEVQLKDDPIERFKDDPSTATICMQDVRAVPSTVSQLKEHNLPSASDTRHSYNGSLIFAAIFFVCTLLCLLSHDSSDCFYLAARPAAPGMGEAEK
ncbi:hypothetical protein T492DRAFT_1122768 [Pavlovales sp. CCMP2436]|nr:hypothetical protein T492DRAFT_1122768 [Pavlovales sp. CCMP2436]